ncbi:MAG: RimK family alpha-L-glutamate ligase, partial [Flavobacteriales bacterium]|nr:RimK family alpha-L-glutamate ligase [Flavobacteriales bacterium]
MRPVPRTNAPSWKFRQAAENLGFAVDIIGPDDIDRIAEYDALFIRAACRVNGLTAWRAGPEPRGLAVGCAGRDPQKCNNKGLPR